MYTVAHSTHYQRALLMYTVAHLTHYQRALLNAAMPADDAVAVDANEFRVVGSDDDLMVAYSTTDGNVSWRNSSEGSWYLQTLCDVFVDRHEETARSGTANDQRAANEADRQGSNADSGSEYPELLQQQLLHSSRRCSPVCALVYCAY